MRCRAGVPPLNSTVGRLELLIRKHEQRARASCRARATAVVRGAPTVQPSTRSDTFGRPKGESLCRLCRPDRSRVQGRRRSSIKCPLIGCGLTTGVHLTSPRAGLGHLHRSAPRRADRRGPGALRRCTNGGMIAGAPFNERPLFQSPRTREVGTDAQLRISKRRKPN